MDRPLTGTPILPAALGKVLSVNGGGDPLHAANVPPHGPPAAQQERFALPRRRIEEIAACVGTPFFLYDQRAIDAAVTAVRGALPARARLCFAVKANPAPGILTRLAAQGLGAEVASAGELALALRAGIAADAIVFSGPAKTEIDHLAAIRAGVAALHVESGQELAALNALCGLAGCRARVALRVAFPAAPGSRRLGWGARTPFGMEPEEAVALAERQREFPHINLVGPHVHATSQLVDEALFVARLRTFGAFCGTWRDRFGLAYANIGGGLGVPEYADDRPLDLAPVGRALAELAMPGAPFAGLGPGLTAEPGRFLVGPAGSYVARVVRTREIGGQRFAFLDGGTHHVLRLSGTQRALRRPVDVACLRSDPTGGLVPFELAGPLCTPVDRLASNAMLPADLAPGDLLVFGHVGAYAKGASPLGFLGHDLPAEILVDGSGETLIASRQPVADFWLEAGLPATRWPRKGLREADAGPVR